MKLIPSRHQLRQSWEKYGLIIIGNIVFFALLYFLSYRPHNEENRAAEFLSMAQQAETEDSHRTATVLYRKVLTDYGDTRSAATAKARLKYLRLHFPKEILKEPAIRQPIFDMEKMLDQRPSVYVARFMAAHYDETPELKSRIRQTIEDYLKIAINNDGVPLKLLRAEKEFQRPEFQEAWFTVKPRCQMKPDWIYDDFFIKNTGIFPWHNVRIQVEVSQGTNKATAEVRIPLLRPGRLHELTGFDVDKSGGEVTCSGQLKSREGKASFQNRI